ncbi:glycosyltransferase family 2 protein [Paenibacillus sp. YIM B09110]|uniref:glycosyltransferase family 2 protein n=1 Tax=Paenibacillus sp. YIM B09110 TaxID=3126102 RepID=UPI00301C68C0
MNAVISEKDGAVTGESLRNGNTSSKILIIIPAYNEEHSISHVIKDVKTHCPSAHILVINDGSKDRTKEVAEANGAAVITLPTNLGIGGAMQTGYRYAHRYGYDVAVQVDGDGQHKAEQLHLILSPVLSGKADLAIGSRFIEQTGFQSTTSRRIGIKILSTIVSAMTRKKVLDVTSGFRAANKRAISVFQSDYATDYPEVDSIVLVNRSGLRTSEVAVTMEARTGGTSSINAMRSVYYMIKVTLALFIRSLKQTKPVEVQS